MINGLVVLSGLCIAIVMTAKKATSNEKEGMMDFYDFFDLEKPVENAASKLAPEPEPVPKLQLRVIQGGKGR